MSLFINFQRKILFCLTLYFSKMNEIYCRLRRNKKNMNNNWIHIIHSYKNKISIGFQLFVRIIINFQLFIRVISIHDEAKFS